MAEHGFFDAEHTEKYIVMTKFRNKVVHLYHEIEDKEIYAILQNNLDDFRMFIKTATALTQKKRPKRAFLCLELICFLFS